MLYICIMYDFVIVVVVGILLLGIIYFCIYKKDVCVIPTSNVDSDVMVIPRTSVVEKFFEERNLAVEKQARMEEQILMGCSDNIDDFISMEDFFNGFKPTLSEKENDAVVNSLLHSVPVGSNDEINDEPVDFQMFELNLE